MGVKVQRAEIVFLSPDELPKAVNVPCDGCPAPCCRHPRMRVFLTFDEAREFAFELVDAVMPGGRIYKDVAVLAKHDDGTCMYIRGDGKCGVHATRPQACRWYDCRGDPSLGRLTAIRFGADGATKAGVDSFESMTAQREASNAIVQDGWGEDEKAP